MARVVLPQAMRIVLPPLVGQMWLLIKVSSVVSAIGLTDSPASAGWWCSACPTPAVFFPRRVGYSSSAIR